MVIGVRVLLWLWLLVFGLGVCFEIVLVVLSVELGFYNVLLLYCCELCDDLVYGFIGVFNIDNVMYYVYDVLYDVEVCGVLFVGFVEGVMVFDDI